MSRVVKSYATKSVQGGTRDLGQDNNIYVCVDNYVFGEGIISGSKTKNKKNVNQVFRFDWAIRWEIYSVVDTHLMLKADLTIRVLTLSTTSGQDI